MTFCHVSSRLAVKLHNFIWLDEFCLYGSIMSTWDVPAALLDASCSVCVLRRNEEHRCCFQDKKGGWRDGRMRCRCPLMIAALVFPLWPRASHLKPADRSVRVRLKRKSRLRNGLRLNEFKEKGLKTVGSLLRSVRIHQFSWFRWHNSDRIYETGWLDDKKTGNSCFFLLLNVKQESQQESQQV